MNHLFQLTLLLSIALQLGAQAATPASSAPDTTPAIAHAKYIVLGYLWSDGSFSQGAWHFRSRNAQTANQFAAAAAAIGAKITQREKPPFHAFQITDGPTTVPLTRAPFDIEKATPDDIKAFLAAVIEGEGSKEGLVIDDPDRRHAETMAQLLARVGVKTRLEGSKFFRLYAEKESWPIIQSFPFVAWGRVPGGQPATASSRASK